MTLSINDDRSTKINKSEILETPQEMSTEQLASSTHEVLECGLKNNYSKDYVTDQLFNLIQSNPNQAAEMGFPNEYLDIKKKMVEAFYTSHNHVTQDATNFSTADRDNNSAEESLAATDTKTILSLQGKLGYQELMSRYKFNPRAETDPSQIYENLTPYREHITKVSTENGLDPKLATAVIINESGGNPVASSPTGAKGMMQLVSFIAGKNTTLSGEAINPYDAKKNIERGIKLLSYLSKKFDGNVEKIAAAYNQGEGKVMDAISTAKKNGGNWKDYFDSVEGQKYIKAISTLLDMTNKRSTAL